MSGGLENYFDTCKMDNSVSPPVVTCLNFMGEVDKNYMHGNNLALCEHHYCLITESKAYGTHDTLSCSGGVMRFGDDNYYYNPITPFIMDFKLMKPMPSSAVNLLGMGIDYYYAKDVRTRFSQALMSVNCTNDFKTCVTFSNSSLCFGNESDQRIIHSQQAVTWGAMTSVAIGSLTVFVVMPMMKKRPPWQVFAMYLLPVVAAILIYFGLALSPKLPFAAGNFLVMWTFPFVFYAMRDVYRDSVGYTEVEQRDDRAPPTVGFGKHRYF